MMNHGLIYAARGIFDDDADARTRRGGNDPSDTGGFGPEEEVPGAPTSGGESLGDAVGRLEDAIRRRPSPVVVNNAPTVNIVRQNAVETAEGARAFGRFVVDATIQAIDQNTRGITSKIEQAARRAVT
jgi:hypothetical protein